MANKRVDQLDDIDALAGGDSFPVRDASAPTELKEVTATQVAAFIDAAGAAATAITGTKLDDLATPDDNTDLNATTGHHGLLPKLGGGTTNFLRADGTWAAPAGGGSAPPDSWIPTITPLAGAGFQAWFASGGITVQTNRYAAVPIYFLAAATIEEIAIEVTTGVASSDLKVGIFNESATVGVPGTLIATLGSFDCSSTGKKTLSSLSQAVSANTTYYFGFISSTADLCVVRGVATATSGPSVTQVNSSVVPTVGGLQLGDNLPRFQAWHRAVPASNGNFDNTPTWNRSATNIEIPNFSVDFA